MNEQLQAAMGRHTSLKSTDAEKYKWNYGMDPFKGVRISRHSANNIYRGAPQHGIHAMKLNQIQRGAGFWM